MSRQTFVASILAVVVVALIAVASGHRVFAQVIDEPIHIAAGYDYLRTGAYLYDIEHPPLALEERDLLLSGRLVPLTLMPDWVQTLAWLLPFRWTFYFPIETLVGELSNAELLAGLGMQLVWTLIGIALFSLVWRRAVRHYTAVGN